MSKLRKSHNKASAREQINILGAQEDVLLLPRGQYRSVLEVSSVNFELMSEDEQDALIDTYENFLNALPCPLQIIVRLRALDMSTYLAGLSSKRASELEPVYQEQIEAYSTFVESLVQDNQILSRQFYIVVPCNAGDFASAKAQLSVTADLIAKGLQRLGMRTRQLTSLELLGLFQSFYNPEQARTQPIAERVVQVLSSEYIRRAI